MPDEMDRVQALVEAQAEDALKRHTQRPRIEGRTHCANAECDAAIHPVRHASGAQLCIDCQADDERARARYARGKG